MRISAFNVFNANGTPEECAEFTVRVSLLLKAIQDDEKKRAMESEIDEIWNAIKKGKDDDGKPN